MKQTVVKICLMEHFINSKTLLNGTRKINGKVEESFKEAHKKLNLCSSILKHQESVKCLKNLIYKKCQYN